MEVDSLQRKELDRLGALLVQRFSPPLRAEDVERCLLSCLAEFESARVRTYVTLLVERAATDQLRVELQRVEAGNNGNWSAVMPIAVASPPIAQRRAS